VKCSDHVNAVQKSKNHCGANDLSVTVISNRKCVLTVRKPQDFECCHNVSKMFHHFRKQLLLPQSDYERCSRKQHCMLLICLFKDYHTIQENVWQMRVVLLYQRGFLLNNPTELHPVAK
jgi:hypothetical protein